MARLKVAVTVTPVAESFSAKLVGLSERVTVGGGGGGGVPPPATVKLQDPPWL